MQMGAIFRVDIGFLGLYCDPCWSPCIGSAAFGVNRNIDQSSYEPVMVVMVG